MIKQVAKTRDDNVEKCKKKHWYKAMSIISQRILIVIRNIKAEIYFIILFQNQNKKEEVLHTHSHDAKNFFLYC